MTPWHWFAHLFGIAGGQVYTASAGPGRFVVWWQCSTCGKHVGEHIIDWI